MKDNIKNIEDKSLTWEKIFAKKKNTFDKGLLLQIYKELFKLSIKKTEIILNMI